MSNRARLSLLLLLSAAVLSNLFPITVPLVLLYLPASVFTYLILRLFGIPWAALCAVASALVVPLAVGHPYAVIWYILELAFVVWFCQQRKHSNLIAAVALYWIALGTPLVALSFYLLDVHPEVSLLISAKNCVNGIANATLGCLLFQLLPLRKWLLNEPNEQPFPLAQHLFSLLLGFLMIPAVVMLIGHLQGSMAQMESRISQDLSGKSLAISGQIELLAEQSQASAAATRTELLERLKIHWSSKDAEHGSWILTLLNDDKILISSSERLKPGSRFNPNLTADLAEVPGGALHRLPHASRLFMPVANRWRQSSYLTISELETVPGWRLVVEKPVQPFLKQLRWAAIRIFCLLTLLTYPALLLASWVSRRIALPLSSLSQLTFDLSKRLQRGNLKLHWPKTRINEINELNQNAQAVAVSLQQTFAEITHTKQHLEERVAARTEQLHLANASLTESEQRYFTLAEASPVGIFSVNAHGSCVYVNQRWCQMVGMTQQQALNSGWAKHIHQDDHCKVFSAWNQMISAQRAFQMEFRIDHPETGTIWVFGLATPQFDAQGNLQDIIGTLTDISERVATEQQLRNNQQRLNFLAHHDSLTGLANRLCFKDRLEHAMAQAQRNDQQVALFFLDLDRFKNINDSLGHSCGDKLLQVIAERLRNCCRQSDTIARFGGDEFMVMMERVEDITQVSPLAKKILQQLAEPIELSDHPCYTTASLGISIYPNDGTSVEELLKCADTALYRAKDLGRNNYQYYTADMNAQSHSQLLLENCLRKALERDQFLLHYQPQLDLQTGVLVGFEALLRWQHPEHGLLYPDRFIPLAEETGLIEPIGEWVLQTACAQNFAWQHAGYPAVRMAVNISARQFHRSDLLTMISRILTTTGLATNWLELELTESMIIGNTEGAIKIMQSLNQMGIQLSIDDFGTGYSSLAYLKRFPINKLKIAQAFIKDILEDPNDAAIADAVISLAKSMQLQVIAEGVEKPAQLVVLQKMGCNLGQGYLLGRPTDTVAAEQYLASHVLPEKGNLHWIDPTAS